jgi:type I restriction enzyme S subunit
MQCRIGCIIFCVSFDMHNVSGWRTATLSTSILSLDAGVSVNAEDRPHRAGEIGVLKTSAISGGVFRPEQNKAVLPMERALVAEPIVADSILLSRMNTPALVGECCYIEEARPTLFLPDRIWQLRPKNRADVSMRWLSFVLRSDSTRAYIETHASGTSGSMKNLAKSKLMALPVDYPPFSEQVAIAEILDSLDTTIRQTEAIIEKLKLVKQGLLHDLLTRGIDAGGELRPPQSQAPHLYKNSPLGWIPIDWRCSSMTMRCSLITKGTTPAADDMWQGDDGIRFLRVDNLSFDGKFDLLASRFRISPVTHRGALSRSRCLPGDVLTNIVGPPLGKLGLVTVETGEVNINQAIALFRPSLELSSEFLLLWLSSSVAQSWLGSRAKQTSGQLNLTLALCHELPIPDICLDEQQRIVERFGAVQNRITLEECELVKLRKLKDGLLDDLLTGRVRVTPLLLEPLGA